MIAESSGGVFAPNASTNDSSMKSANPNNDDNSNSSPPIFGNMSVGLSTSRSFPNNTDLTHVAAKIESLKKWTVNTYKTTKHSINEHFGKVQKTVDKDLEERIEVLRELERRYQEILTAVRGFTNHFQQANKMQRMMAEAMYQLSCKEDIMNNELATHSTSLRGVSQEGEIFYNALNNFISALETVVDTTIRDTFLTIEHHDQARLEYDVCRYEIENLRLNPNPHISLENLEQDCNAAKTKYEQLKEDVRVKLTLLEDNRCNVVPRQIAIIQRALIVYYTGSMKAVKEAIDQLDGETGLLDARSSLHDTDPMCPSHWSGHRSSFLEQ